MYQSIFYDRTTYLVHLWDDKAGYSKFKKSKYAFKLSKNGNWKTLDGKSAELVKNWEDIDVRAGLIYEHDAKTETRILIDKYLDENDAPEHRTLFFDIEVERDAVSGYSSTKDAFNKITSIACRYGDVKKIFILSDTITDRKTLEYELKAYKNERDVISAFMFYFKQVDPTILSGWNIQYYDIPYLINRMKNIGMEYYRISPIGIIEEGRDGDSYEIAGRNILDYMYLYKNFSANEESSYTLDAISKKVLGRGKVEYEGSLQTLYETDIEKFIRYNIEDVDLVYEMDKKLLYLELAADIVHTCHVSYSDVYTTSFLLDGAALTYLRRKGIVAPAKIYGSTDLEKIDGAWVKLPDPGLYEWVFDLDLKALYPTIMQTLNISPETKRGKILNWDQDKFHTTDSTIYAVRLDEDNLISLNKTQLEELFNNEKLSVASNGVLYSTEVKGFIPEILQEWSFLRDHHKSLMKEAHKAGDSAGYTKHYIKQYTQKIISNSFYGVLLLSSFRFSDRENGEAITLTGQSVIKHSFKIANLFYNKKLKTTDKDYVIYADTDSLFMSATPLIENLKQKSEEELIEDTLRIAGEVQHIINASYDLYAKKYHNVNKHGFQIKQEMVGKTAIWTGVKKRYAIFLVNKEGMKVDEFEFKGIDVVRSNFPKASRLFMTNFLKSILRKESKDEIINSVKNFYDLHKTIEIDQIMLPTGVKNLSDYSTSSGFGKFKKGAPAHSKAALAYNMLINKFGGLEYPKIPEQEKVRWAYLRPNEYHLDAIAIPNENVHPKIYNFIKTYIDREKMFENNLVSKLQDFYDVLKWGKVNVHSNQNSFF